MDSLLPKFDTLTVVVFLLVAAYYGRLWSLSSSNKNYAPGPKGWPIVENTFQVPTAKSWLYFQQLGEKYGPIIRFRLAGREFVVLNNLEDTEELLGKRSANYSSRQQLIFAGRYRSHDKRLVLLPYGSLLKKQRAALHQAFNPNVVHVYEHAQDIGSMKLLSDILKKPADSYTCIKWYSAETLLNIVYGRRFSDSADGLKDLRTLQAILESVIQDFHPRKHLVDTFPLLDLLPDFLSPWRIEAKRLHEFEYGYYNRLLHEVKAKMDAGQSMECLAARMWEEQEKLDLDEESMTYAAGSAFEAGTDNPAGTILWAVVAAMNYPEVRMKLLEELDMVVGAEGLVAPGFQHLDQLPYCISYVKEVLRWLPVAPIPPHCSIADDEYKGYFIPKDTIVFPNTWAIHHNPERFPEPSVFKPERHMPKAGEVLTVNDLVEGHCGFGYGRRICPGQFLAAKNVWLGIIRILWAFDPVPAFDAQGKPIIPNPDDVRRGITQEPATFYVNMTPRSSTHVKTINDFNALHV